jgi:hypothetical protein
VWGFAHRGNLLDKAPGFLRTSSAWGHSAGARRLRVAQWETNVPELRISTDKVCDFIETAREVAGQVPPTTGDRTTSGDDSPLMTIEDNPAADDRRRQMSEFIAGLNIDEQIDLLALIYVGRGDFEVSEWGAAVREANARIGDRDADYMIGDAALPEYLGTGLNAFDRGCG